MENNYNRETLYDLRIHELRDLARKLGVKAPTMLKKEVIAEEIMDILSGKKSPHVKENNKGRPAKSGTSEIADFFIPAKLYEQDDNFDLTSNQFQFYVNSPEIAFNFSDEGEAVEGLLDTHNAGYGVLRLKGYNTSDKDIFVSGQMIAQYKLRTGNRIKGEAKDFHPNKPRALVKISTIDGKDPVSYEKLTPFEEIPAIHNKQDMHFQYNGERVHISKGGRNLVLVSDKLFATAKEIAQQLSSEKRKVVLVNFNSLPEEEMRDESFEYINISCSLDEPKQANVVNLAFEATKRRVESGQDIILVVKGLSQILRAINTSITNRMTIDEISIPALHKLKLLIMSAKQPDRGSLTLLFIDNLHKAAEPVRKLIQYDIVNLFNNVINL